jgi:hypothetical protein
MAPKRKPTEKDVVKHWFHISDSTSLKSKSPKDKNLVITKVIKSITNHWMIQGYGSTIKTSRTIRDKLKTVLNKVETLKSSKHPTRKFDFDWQSDQVRLKGFDKIFDLNKSTKDAPVKENSNNEVDDLVRLISRNTKISWSCQYFHVYFLLRK